MTIQPLDLLSPLRAVTWPLITIVAFAMFRQPLGNVVCALMPRMNKLSVGTFSIELMQVREMQPRAMDTEIRQLEAELMPQTGSNALATLVNELQSGGQHDCVLIDLGSELSLRWLTSRLYLLCFLITLINRQLCLVLAETLGNVRKRFVGTASPAHLRWALARNYGWLESGCASAYAAQVSNPTTGFLLSPTPAKQFDPATGLFWTMIANLIQQFLQLIRSSAAPPEPKRSEWITLNKSQAQIYEHAKWVNGGRIERLLGSDLRTARVTLLANRRLHYLSDPVLDQAGRFVAVVEPDKAFHSQVDRQLVLESVAFGFARAASATSSKTI